MKISNAADPPVAARTESVSALLTSSVFGIVASERSELASFGPVSAGISSKPVFLGDSAI